MDNIEFRYKNLVCVANESFLLLSLREFEKWGQWLVHDLEPQDRKLCLPKKSKRWLKRDDSHWPKNREVLWKLYDFPTCDATDPHNCKNTTWWLLSIFYLFSILGTEHKKIWRSQNLISYPRSSSNQKLVVMVLGNRIGHQVDEIMNIQLYACKV